MTYPNIRLEPKTINHRNQTFDAVQWGTSNRSIGQDMASSPAEDGI